MKPPESMQDQVQRQIVGDEARALAPAPAVPHEKPIAAPPLPNHPEAHTMRWSRLEEEAITRHGRECFDAGYAAGYRAGHYDGEQARTAAPALHQDAAISSPGAVASLLGALKTARDCIATDRTALADCHMDPDTNKVDGDGQAGLDEYDAVLAKIDAAIDAARASLTGAKGEQSRD